MNKYKYIFFDLDGTLLNMNTDEFVVSYTDSLIDFYTRNGYESEKVKESIKKGTIAMINNDGSKTNEDLLLQIIIDNINCDAEKNNKLIEKYYNEEFDKLKKIAKLDNNTDILIKKLKNSGYKLILATNPMFPKIATHKRIKWAGLTPSDFEIITTYENERYSKPNLKYYESLLSRLNVSAKDCIMVGNNVNEDMCAENLGIDVFLITTNLDNNKNKDISLLKQGSLKDFDKFIFNIN